MTAVDPDAPPATTGDLAARYPLPERSIDPDPGLGWIRRLAPIIGRHRGTVVRSLLMAIVAVGALLVAPLVSRAAIDGAIATGEGSLWPYVAALVALGIGRGVFAYAYRYGLYGMAYAIDFDLRTLMYRHLTHLSFSFYDRVQTGQIISRANADIRSVQFYLAMAPLLATSLTSFAVALVIMLAISPLLTLVAVAPMPLVYLAGVALRERMFPLSWIIQSRQAELATIVEENVTGVRVVKSFAAEEAQVTELARSARRLRWANVTQADLRARWGPLLEHLPRLGLVAVLGVGGWLVIQGRASVGDIVAFNAYIAILQIPFRLLGFFVMLGQRARASAGRIFEILDEPPDVTERPGARPLPRPRGEVRFEDVTFGYGNGPAVLDGFTMDLEPGARVALVGRTGCGKSTVARLLPRGYDVRSGAVRLDGHDVRDLTLDSLRRAVGVVAEDAFLFSASVRDNLAYARPGAADDEIEAAARAAQAWEFVDALPEGLDTVIGERGYTLSGGQRQRLAIARTLLADPRVLVLDDATSAIDVGVEQRLHAALGELMAGRTTLVIAHRLSTIALADRVVLMAGGRVVAEGTHADLLAREPAYAEVLAQGEEWDRAHRPGSGDEDRDDRPEVD